MNCSWVRPALRVSSEMLLIMPARPPWIPRSPREQVEQTLVTPPGDHVQRTLSLGVAQVWVGAVAQEQLNVSPIAALLHQRVERGGALRVPEVHVGVVAEEPLRGLEAAPLDRAQKGRLVFRNGVEAGAGLHEHVDGLHVVVKARRPEAILRRGAAPQEELRQGQVAAPRERIPERGGLEGTTPIDEGRLVDVEAAVEKEPGQRERARRGLVARGKTAEEMERAAAALVRHPQEPGMVVEERRDRLHIESLDGTEEPRLAHSVTPRRARRPAAARPAPPHSPSLDGEAAPPPR